MDLSKEGPNDALAFSNRKGLGPRLFHVFGPLAEMA